MKKVRFNASAISKFVTGKGFYLVLSCSVAAIALAGYIAYNQTVKLINDNLTDNDGIEYGSFFNADNDNVAVDEKTPDVPKTITEDTTSIITTADTEAVNQDANSTRPMVMPVNGEILNDFSNGELVKSKTLGTWQTHDGIDISAVDGTNVYSMTTGTVTEVKEDALWGICIIVDHKNGLEGHYYGLSEDVSVKAGDEVKAGDTIGKAGNSAEAECAEEPHIHFGVKQDGSWIDPQAVITVFR